jgi:hypothetical protein
MSDSCQQHAHQTSSPHKFNRYRRPRLPIWLRRYLGCKSYDLVLVAGCPVSLRNYILTYHNLYHFELSCLERIEIAGEMVSGIHGFNSPMFHDQSITPEYAGILDELRLAVHECLTQRSPYTTFKFFNWCIWMVLNGINPIEVCWRHITVLKQGRQFEKANLNTVWSLGTTSLGYVRSETRKLLDQH